MRFKKEIVTVLATGALFISSLTPMALADTTISGNGAVSENNVSANQNSTTTVDQNNTANITNTVDTSSNTGGNHADFNTGGSTAISTGNASATTDIVNKANMNVADISGCNTCSTGTGSVAITGNGAFSNSNVNANNNTNTTLSQNNNANFDNQVSSKATTGNNSANYNTGGDTKVLTGDASNDTSISNMANANWAQIGDGNSGNTASSAIIAGNGAKSDNQINSDNNSSTTVRQDNYARIANDVWSNANTGNNKANYNTGGDVLVATGNARNNTAIDNMANFNMADLANCGCITGAGVGNILEYGNGAFSDNTVNANGGNKLTASQHNNADIANAIRNGYKNGTGNNSLFANTGWNGASSYLFTGDSGSNTNLKNAANVNGISNGLGFNLGGMDFHVLFDMNGLLNQLHLN